MLSGSWLRLMRKEGLPVMLGQAAQMAAAAGHPQSIHFLVWFASELAGDDDSGEYHGRRGAAYGVQGLVLAQHLRDLFAVRGIEARTFDHALVCLSRLASCGTLKTEHFALLFEPGNESVITAFLEHTFGSAHGTAEEFGRSKHCSELLNVMVCAEPLAPYS